MLNQSFSEEFDKCWKDYEKHWNDAVLGNADVAADAAGKPQTAATKFNVAETGNKPQTTAAKAVAKVSWEGKGAGQGRRW